MNKYEYKVQGVDYEVEIEEVEGNIAKVKVNGISFEVELKQPINAATAISHPRPVTPPVAAAPAGTGTPVKAPLPGTITSVNVKVGDKVNTGDAVVVLEAMKMQNNIEAESTGTVTSIAVNVGDSVMEGAVLITIA